MTRAILGRTVAEARCKRCGAPIVWTVTQRGRAQPIDADPSADGNIALVDEWVPSGRGVAPRSRVVKKAEQGELLAADDRYLAHFVTCPYADEFRKKDR